MQRHWMKKSKMTNVIVFLSLALLWTTSKAGEGKHSCLATQDKVTMQSMKQSIQTLQSGISKLESSLRGQYVIQMHCPTDWKRYQQSCYLFSKDKKTWFAAERHCKENGGSLADVENESENAWLLSSITEKLFFSLWLGATNMKKNQWLWNADFRPFTYSNWKKDEPNGAAADCLHMSTETNNSAGEWNDHDCNTNMKYVCKKKLKCDCHNT